MDYKKLNAIIYAILAALFYAINIPCSKILLGNVAPTFMAAFLYLGAGLGVDDETEITHSQILDDGRVKVYIMV